MTPSAVHAPDVLLRVLGASGALGRPSARARASAASCAASRSPTSTATSSTSSSAACMCACRGCYLLFTPEGAGGGRYRAVPDRYLSFPDFALSPGQWDSAADPGQRGVLLPELDARPGRRVLPEPGRRHRVAAAARHLGRGRRRQPRAGDLAPTSRRSCARRPHGGGAASATSCRSTPATSWSASCAGSGGASTAGGGARRAGSVLRRRAVQPAVAAESRPMSDARRSRSSARGRAPRRGADAHAAPARHRADAAAGARRRAAVPDPIEPQRRRYEPAEEERLVELFGEHAAVGRHAAAVPVDPRRHHRPGFTGATEVDLPVPCTYDFEVAARQVPPRASTTARSRSCCCSPAPCS